MASLSPRRRCSTPTVSIPSQEQVCVRKLSKDDELQLHSPTNWMHAFASSPSPTHSACARAASLSPLTAQVAAVSPSLNTPNTKKELPDNSPVFSHSPRSPLNVPLRKAAAPLRRFSVGNEEHDCISSAIAALMRSPDTIFVQQQTMHQEYPLITLSPVAEDIPPPAFAETDDDDASIKNVEFDCSFGKQDVQSNGSSILTSQLLKSKSGETHSLPSSPLIRAMALPRKFSMDSGMGLAPSPSGSVRVGRFTVRRL